MNDMISYEYMSTWLFSVTLYGKDLSSVLNLNLKHAVVILSSRLYIIFFNFLS